jgi:hypothetical protein
MELAMRADCYIYMTIDTSLLKRTNLMNNRLFALLVTIFTMIR